MVRCSYYHMPVWLHNIVMEHGVGTHRFHSKHVPDLDLASLSLGRTLDLGLELGLRPWFVAWITGEIVPLSKSPRDGSDSVCWLKKILKKRNSVATKRCQMQRDIEWLDALCKIAHANLGTETPEVDMKGAAEDISACQTKPQMWRHWSSHSH